MTDNTLANNYIRFRDTYMKVKEQFGSVRHISMTMVDVVNLLGLLLYLKRNNSLALDIPEKQTYNDMYICSYDNKCYSFNSKLLQSINNVEFKELIERVIYKTHEAEEPKFTMELASIIDEVVLEDDEYLALFDMAIAGIHGYHGVLFPPHEFSLISSSFINDNVRRIYDPFGGIMDLATTMTTNNRHFVANEIHQISRDIALFRLAIKGIIDQTTLDNNPLGCWTNEKFDAIITNPPIGLKIQMKDQHSLGFKEDSELIAFQRFDQTTNTNGQLITIVPVSFLTSERENIRRLREYITQNNWLDTIICLPKSLFFPFSGIATAIVVLQKQRSSNEAIHLFDASNYETNESLHNIVNKDAVYNSNDKNHLEITQEEILTQNSSWNVQWYIDRHNQVFSDGYSIVECSSVIRQIAPKRHFQDNKGRYVNVTALSSDCYNYEKAVGDFPETDNLKGTSKITKPVLLLSLIGTPKPTFCKASEQTPIFVKSDVCAYEITNNTVHIGYLCMELAKRLKAANGNVIPRLSKTQIISTRIEFPSLNGERSLIEQKNIFEKAKNDNQESQIKLLGLQEYVDKIKKEFKESIRGRKHAIGQNLGDISSFWNVLNSYRKEKNGILNDSDIVDEDYKMTVDGLFNAIDYKLNVTLEQIKNLLSEEDEWGEPEEIEPEGFIAEFIKSHNDIRFNFIHDGFDSADYLKSLEEIEIDYWAKIIFPQKALIRIFENIINNAVEYGFTDPNRKDYKIRISQEFIDIDRWEIKIANNGTPVPDSFDCQKVFNLGYTTQIEKGHSGTGAYQVKQLLESYGGEVRFENTPNQEYTVSYVLTFKKLNIEV